MLVFIFFITLAFILFQKSKYDLFKQNIFENSSFIIGSSVFIVYGYAYFEENFQTNIYYIFFIPLFLFLLKYIKLKTSQKSLEIIAEQQRYFDEVNAKMIEKFYKSRKYIKSNRVEVFVNKESKKLIKEGIIIPQFFLDYKNINPRKVNNLIQLEENVIFKIIFKKLKNYIKLLEVKINYEEQLKQNDNFAEFFLMELWEKYTFKFNISVANLQVLTNDKADLEFLGALDLIHLNCVKRNGAVFYYKYLKYKNRIKEYLENNVDENPANDKIFDENYLMEQQ